MSCMIVWRIEECIWRRALNEAEGMLKVVLGCGCGVEVVDKLSSLNEYSTVDVDLYEPDDAFAISVGLLYDKHHCMRIG